MKLILFPCVLVTSGKPFSNGAKDVVGRSLFLAVEVLALQMLCCEQTKNMRSAEEEMEISYSPSFSN